MVVADWQTVPEKYQGTPIGDLMEYVGDKRISQGRETYRIQFENRSGRLLIEGFHVVKSDRMKEEKE